MKYQNKILSVLKEAINTSSEVQDIITATQNAENQFKSQGYGPDQAKTLAINAVTKSVMGDDDTINEVGDEKVHTAKFDRCVKDVEEKGGVDNPYAICQASIGAGAIKKDHRTKPEDEYDRTQHEQKEEKTPEDTEAGSKDYEEFQDAIKKSMEPNPPVGKIKKEELERVMESLKPKKKIIKVKELKSKK
jgi:hypothetical protein